MVEGKKMEDEFKLKPDDPDHYLLFIEEGWDDKNQRKAPIAKLPGGRTALFYREHHRYLRPGETWECRIDQDRTHFTFVVPIKLHNRAAAMPEALPKSISPQTANMILEGLRTRIEVLKGHVEEQKRVIDPYEEKRAELLAELKNLDEQLFSIKETYDTSRKDLEKLLDAVSEIEGLTKHEGVTVNDLSKNTQSGDFWGELTQAK